MRFLVGVRIPTDVGNATLKAGPTLQKLIEARN